MTANELRKKFIDFFVGKGHKEIPSASLIPENDPTTLFISAGMHPLVPYLLGEPHPLGRRLCSVQKCLRTDDMDEVGDESHHTFFEMMGNWSLGDYWKEEAISWSFEFLTKHLGMDPKILSITCFAGDADAPKDEESANIWRKLGIPQERVYFLPKKDNWWGPAGKTGPCGPDTEMFFDTGRKSCSSNCRPGCHCGKYIEIWNDVFMQYEKRVKEWKSGRAGEKEEYEFVPLRQRNIDTGMGVERVGIFNGIYDNYQTDLFLPVIKRIEELSGKSYGEEANKRPMRIIADYLRAAVFLIGAGIVPGNKEREYVLRRFIRRASDQIMILKIEEQEMWQSAINVFSRIYTPLYDEVKDTQRIEKVIASELATYRRVVTRTATVSAKARIAKKISGAEAFKFYSTYGLSKDQLKEKGYIFSDEEFAEEMKKHQEISRIGAEKKFAGGLADHSEVVTKYHTATHLLHAALRKVLGEHVQQVGSNLTSERLRFDFTHPEKLTEAEIEQTEDLVNEMIEADLPVKMEIMSLEEAKKAGALAFFEQKYGEKVKVYTIGEFSKEVCGGPHVQYTGEIGKIEIFKEEAVGTGKRRIYARIK